MKKKTTIFLLLFIIIAFILPLQAQAATEPIAHFKFDDGSGTSPDDSSTNNITAAFTATNPTWSTDISSAITFNDPYSLDFSGNGDAVTVTWPAGLNFADTDPRSFSFWYKPTANGEGLYSRIISWSNDRLEIAGTNNSASTHKIAYFDGNWNETDITLTIGTWYHVIFTYDGTTAKFYINNELQDEHSLAGRSLSGTMRIGNRVQQLDEGINGKIDDVRVYDYALNTSQIENLSSGSNDPDGDPDPTPTPTQTPQSSSSSNNNISLSNCSTQRPSSAPDLFQVSTSPTTATLYFSPVNPATGYIINYGTSSEANQYSASFNYTNGGGAVPYTINYLLKGTLYYFKVQGKNDCAPGNWSQVLSQTTTGNKDSFFAPTATANGTINVVNREQTSNSRQEELQQEEAKTPDIKNGGYELTIKVISEGKPVENAVVEVHSTPRRSTTDKSGIARFSDVEKGEHTVYLSYGGYQGQEKVTVDGESKDIEVNLTVELKPSNTFLSPMAIWIIVCLIGIVIILLFIFLKRQKKFQLIHRKL